MTSSDAGTWDVIVVGSGGGLLGALFAASRGLRTLVLEKTDKVGGTTAYSGAGLWYPGSAPIARAGIEDDDIEAGRTYLRSVVDDQAREKLQDAYLDAGVALIDELEQNEWFPDFTHMPVPDYFAGVPGATFMGRTVFPAPVPVAELGAEADLVRRPLFTERFGIDEGEVWTGGRALIGRALKAFLGTGNGELRTDTTLESLIVEDGRVVGVVAVRDGVRSDLRAERGVLLAAGGFERNAELRTEHQALTGEWSNGAPQNTGDAIVAGIAVGADTELMDEAWFVPGVLQPDGKPLFHTGTRGGIWVNADGERFVNETSPYDQSGHVIAHAHKTSEVSHVPTHWVFDQRAMDRFGYGGDPAAGPSPEWFDSGALRKADTLDELAELIGVPIDGLQASVEQFNKYAASGVDEQFHRGETPWDLMCAYIVGFPGGGWSGAAMNYLIEPDPELPNQLLVPMDQPPYYAGQVLLSDIGTKGGLRTDADARVLRADDTAIPGLYATGNTMAAMSGRVYPGAGTPIGSSIAFSYRAVLHLASGSSDGA
ncbi:MAG: FAD-binding protein [Marmoricola sp.]